MADDASMEAVQSIAQGMGYKTWDEMINVIIKANKAKEVPKGMTPMDVQQLIEIDQRIRLK